MFLFWEIFYHSFLLIKPHTPASITVRYALSCTPAFQGLTLDIDKGNLLRLGKDGVILAASHGTRKMLDLEIEKVYGRGRKKHVAFDYATHLHVSTEYNLTESVYSVKTNTALAHL